MAFSGFPFKSLRAPQLSPLRSETAPRWPRLIGPALILLAATVAIAPQLLHGNSCGHDFDFHLVSWLDAQNSWRQGIPYPHWASSANFGAGEPRFVFYPPLTWMLGAALGLVLPWTLVPIALTFLLLAGTGLATRALARQALADGPATLAGCAALFSGYTLFTAYERTAFGELSGGFWIPLLLLLILRDRNLSRAFRAERAVDGAPSVPFVPVCRRALDGSTVPLALVLTGAWLSNAPLGVMASYLLAATALVAALLAKSWASVLRAALAAAVGIALAAFYLVPAAWEQRWVDIRQATGDPGEMVENSWLFARHADPLLALHDVELRRVSWLTVSMLAVALGCALIAWLRGRLHAKAVAQDRRWWLSLALIPLAILFLQLPFSLPVWNALPKLRFLQFPWRWLVVLEAPMGFFFAAAVWPSRRARRVALLTACTAFFLATSAATGRLFFQTCDVEDAVPSRVAMVRSGAGVDGTDEYAPPGADNTLVAMGLPGACLVSDPTTELGFSSRPETNPDWYAAPSRCEATFAASPLQERNRAEHFQFRAIAPHPGYLILRLRSYPAWRVRVNGQLAADQPQREDGLMAVPVPQGTVNLTVDWSATRDVVVGRWLSGLALLLLTALWFLERKLQQSKRPHLS
jgi:hypothetical protein